MLNGYNNYVFKEGKNMKTAITIVTMLVLCAYPLYSAAEESLTPPPVPSQEQPEVLTSGPVHEAFAEPVNLQVQEGLVIPKQPPANIVENAPPERPEGDQFVLVAGYWAWDTDRSDFIWVSACWRAAPPNMYWVPGYWTKVDEGWEWVAGFWAQSGNRTIEYLPAPPVLEDVEPAAPPLEDQIWVPSCQYWYHDHYIVRSGYWVVAQQGWVWVPSHYIWTPRGYAFSAGHWDYSLERRGVLFAPVYFPRGLYLRAGFSFSPSIVISLGMLQLNLFTCPRYSHYYFGDYYDGVYLSFGIFPRFKSERSHIWYDPIYVYDRWNNRRTEPHWADHERHEYDIRHNDKDLRPPRTYHEMETRQAKMLEDQRKNIRMARPLTDVVASKATMRFQQIDTKTQRKITTQATEVQKFSEKRNNWESVPTTHNTAQPVKGNKGTVTQPSEHKEPVSTPAEHKGSMTQPTNKEPVSTPAEHKGSMTQPTNKEPVSTPAEHKGSMTQPTNKEPISTPAEHKGTTQPPEHKESVKPTEHKEPASAPAEHKGAVTQPADNAPAFVPPRQVRATKSDKVDIPKSPVEGKSNAGPPSRPAQEHQQADDTKNKDDKGKDNRANDKGRDRGK